MPNLSIKDVPDDWAQALRQRAARHHRSLQGELMAILEQALQEPIAPGPRPAQSLVVGVDSRGRPIVRRGEKSIEEIAAEHRRHFPEPISDGPRTVELVREHRSRE